MACSPNSGKKLFLTLYHGFISLKYPNSLVFIRAAAFIISMAAAQ
jgi:hypothetical protein